MLGNTGVAGCRLGGGNAARVGRRRAVKKMSKRAGRLPAHYAQVATPEQREKIDKIQDEYKPKIEALQSQIKALKDSVEGPSERARRQDRGGAHPGAEETGGRRGEEGQRETGQTRRESPSSPSCWGDAGQIERCRAAHGHDDKRLVGVAVLLPPLFFNPALFGREPIPAETPFGCGHRRQC